MFSSANMLWFFAGRHSEAFLESLLGLDAIAYFYFRTPDYSYLFSFILCPCQGFNKAVVVLLSMCGFMLFSRKKVYSSGVSLNVGPAHTSKFVSVHILTTQYVCFHLFICLCLMGLIRKIALLVICASSLLWHILTLHVRRYVYSATNLTNVLILTQTRFPELNQVL